MTKVRTTTAFILAPMVVPLAFFLLGIVSADSMPLSLRDAFSYLAIDTVYCLPVAYLAELSLGMIAWHVHRYHQISSLMAFAAVGAVIGAVVALILGSAAGGTVGVVLRPQYWDRPWVLTCVSAASAAAIVFRAIAAPSPQLGNGQR